MINKFSLLLLTLSLLIESCTCNTIHKNQYQDKADAEATIQDFYNLLDSNDSNQLASLFSKKFFKVVDTSQLFAQLTAFENKLGAVNSRHLEFWETNIVEGISNTTSHYLFKYSVKRQKYEAIETFNLEKENGKVKISGYHIDNAKSIN